MRVFEPHHLQTFLAVLEHGGFSRAAAALRVGQSTVSLQIRALEEAAGTRLLDRLGREVRLTPAGKVLRGYAARLLTLHDEAVARVRHEETDARGRVVVTASSIPAEYVLPEVLGAFRAAHPLVEVSIEVADSERALDALLSHQCDIALVGARPTDRRVSYSAVATDEVILVGPKDNRWAPSGRLSRAEFQKVPLVLREPGSGTRQTVAPFLMKHAAGRLDVGSTEAVKRFVLAGLGLGFSSRLAVADELADGRLVEVNLPGLPARRNLYIASTKGVTLPAAAEALMEAIKSFKSPKKRRRG